MQNEKEDFGTCIGYGISAPVAEGRYVVFCAHFQEIYK